MSNINEETLNLFYFNVISKIIEGECKNKTKHICFLLISQSKKTF